MSEIHQSVDSTAALSADSRVNLFLLVSSQSSAFCVLLGERLTAIGQQIHFLLELTQMQTPKTDKQKQPCEILVTGSLLKKLLLKSFCYLIVGRTHLTVTVVTCAFLK